MVSSQENAAVAALTELGYEVPATLVVAGTVEGSDAEGKVEDGDVIVALDGTAVPDYQGLIGLLDEVEAGDTVTLTVRRHGQAVDIPIVTTEKPDGGAQIGVFIDPAFDMPVDVTISIDDIGGPSAGTMFALGIIDKMTPRGRGERQGHRGDRHHRRHRRGRSDRRHPAEARRRDARRGHVVPGAGRELRRGRRPRAGRSARGAHRDPARGTRGHHGDRRRHGGRPADLHELVRLLERRPDRRDQPGHQVRSLTDLVGGVVRAAAHRAPRRTVPQRADDEPHVLPLGVARAGTPARRRCPAASPPRRPAGARPARR